MEYKNVLLIGTSHIAKESVTKIKNEFDRFQPDIIALELDRKRLFALIEKSRRNYQKQKISLKNVFRIGLKGFLFSLLGEWVETKLGDSVGVVPGVDMLTAYNMAKAGNRKVALIDQEIEITLKKLSKAISWREKWNFVVDIFNAVILKKKEIEGFDLRKIPEDKLIEKMINQVKKKYPNVYRVLVSERNNIMAKKLVMLMQQHKGLKIMAVIGAGHEKEMLSLIKKKENAVEVVYSNGFNVDYQ